MKSFKIITFLFCIPVLVMCKPKEKQAGTETEIVSANHYCYIPSDSLIGKQYLDVNALADIGSIAPQEERLTDTSGMVLIQGGTFDM